MGGVAQPAIALLCAAVFLQDVGKGRGVPCLCLRELDLEGGGKRGCEWKNSAMTASPEENRGAERGDTPEDTWWQSRKPDLGSPGLILKD